MNDNTELVKAIEDQTFVLSVIAKELAILAEITEHHLEDKFLDV